jgi:hypothetical protein
LPERDREVRKHVRRGSKTDRFRDRDEGEERLDPNDPAPKYQLKSLPGDFSGLSLVCFMYVAFQSIAPETDIGFDLSKEYAAAKSMHLEKPPH